MFIRILVFLALFNFILTDNLCFEKSVKAEKLLRILFRLEYDGQLGITNDSEFNEYCSKAKNSTKDFKEYVYCLKGLPKQSFGLYNKNLNKFIKHVCHTDIEESKKYFSCFKNKKLMSDFKKCHFQIAETLAFASEKANDSELLPSFCCGFHTLFNCLDKTFDQELECKSDEFNAESYNKLVTKKIFDGLTDLTCGNFNIDVCNNQYSELLKNIEIYRKKHQMSFSNFTYLKNFHIFAEKIVS